MTRQAATSPPASTTSPTESSSSTGAPHAVVDALVPPAEQAEPSPAARSSASAWSKRRPAGPSRNSGRGGSTASTQAKIGSGRITMPAPPPNGVSSTVRWTSVAWSRGSWQRRSSSPAARALPSRLSGRTRRQGREDGEDVDAHGARFRSEVEEAVRGGDPRRPVLESRTKTMGTSAPESSSSSSCAGLATTDTTKTRSTPVPCSTTQNRSAHAPTVPPGRRSLRRATFARRAPPPAVRSASPSKWTSHRAGGAAPSWRSAPGHPPRACSFGEANLG